MSIYDILSMANICLAILLIVSAGFRLSSDACKNVRRAVAGTMVIAVCLVIMHTINIMTSANSGWALVPLLWNFVDMLCIVLLLTLVRVIPVVWRKMDGV